MKKLIHTLVLAMAGIVMVCYYSSCKKVEIVQSTTTDVNIFEFLKENPDSFSLWTKIVEKSGYSGFLNAYGSYTMFAPTNTGVERYLAATSKTIESITENEAKDMVRFHLLEDTVTTAAFKDGKLPVLTMYGQFLVTGVSTYNGASVFNVNRQAVIVKGNIKTGNGFIHSLDNVLIPPKKSIAELVNDDPQYSIFKQALVATGYWDTLNIVNTTDPSRRWLTLLAETNQALGDSGYTSFNALKAKYSQTGNPMNANDSLHIYVAYHIIPDAKYIADIVSASSHMTLAPLEVLTSKLDHELVLINDIEFNGVHEEGIELDRAKSDFSATNGVLHTAKAHFAPKVRVPFPIYWDVADFPEIRKLPAYFRKQNYNFAYGTVKDIEWDKTTNTLGYVFAGTANSSFPVAFGDYLDIPMGNTSRHQWLDFRTPLLVKGKYKLWICYRARKGSGTLGQPGGSFMPVQVFFDGVSTSRTFAFTDQRPNLTDGEMEALGWKRYTVNTSQFMTGKYVGTIDVPTTDRHMIRFLALPPAGTGNPTNHLDMIHIIPVEMNQYLPRFDQLGNPVFN
jgi:uncharacterized surface protein with fasciclin (FAS1) repeats